MESTKRNFAETGSQDDRLDFQRFEHEPLDLLSFYPDARQPFIEVGNKYHCAARIFCPEIRVVSRVSVVFRPKNRNDRGLYNLSTLNSDIVAYRCIHDGIQTARVGEIVGKNGVPLVFPKADIDGISFQTEEDHPYIDLEMNLGFPGVQGAWMLFYHATSNNKLKKAEWEGYITKVTLTNLQMPQTVLYGLPPT